MLLASLLLFTTESPWSKFGFADPVRIKAAGKHIDTTHGHANPLMADFDGNGTNDLLVGQFQEGTLRVYPNKLKTGTPDLQEFSWFMAGGSEGKVPFG